MATLTVTSKGQITLRKDILRHLGAHPGTKLEIGMLPNGGIKLSARAPTGKIANFCGFLKRDAQKPVSIAEMNEIIAKSWADER